MSTIFFFVVPAAPLKPAAPWRTAFTIWAQTSLLSMTFYAGGFALLSEPAVALEFGGLVGLVSAVISLPSIVTLWRFLPTLLRMRERNYRIGSVTGLVVLMFLLCALPVYLSGNTQSLRIDWGAVLFASPGLVAALIAVGYTCRRPLFRPDAQAASENF